MQVVYIHLTGKDCKKAHRKLCASICTHIDTVSDASNPICAIDYFAMACYCETIISEVSSIILCYAHFFNKAISDGI